MHLCLLISAQLMVRSMILNWMQLSVRWWFARLKTMDKCLFDLFFCQMKICRLLVKYLGHILTENMSDDEDIYRQCRALYAQANTLARKFGSFTEHVKLTLFKAYCTPLHTAHLWTTYKKASLQVAYNNALHVLLRRPRWTSASDVCQCPCAVDMYNFMCRPKFWKSDC